MVLLRLLPVSYLAKQLNPGSSQSQKSCILHPFLPHYNNFQYPFLQTMYHSIPKNLLILRMSIQKTHDPIVNQKFTTTLNSLRFLHLTSHRSFKNILVLHCKTKYILNKFQPKVMACELAILLLIDFLRINSTKF